MAGTRGPVPKRSDERRRTNTDAGGIAKGTRGKGGERRPAVNAKWHAIAKRWYLSLANSGQSAFYEPSDWAQAYFIAEAMSRLLNSPPTKGFSANLFAAIDAATVRLMATEADRRRLRIELEAATKDGDPDADASVTAIADWQARLGNG
jgi:hypothetical protein